MARQRAAPPVTATERSATSNAEWKWHLTELFEGDPGPARDLITAGQLELAADNTYDMLKVPTWHNDRTVIIGDAAHAPAPTSGQGASMEAQEQVPESALGPSLCGRCIQESRCTNACAFYRLR